MYNVKRFGFFVETRRESNLALEEPIKEKAADCDWAKGEKESPRIEETTAPADLWRRLDCLTGLPSLPALCVWDILSSRRFLLPG